MLSLVEQPPPTFRHLAIAPIERLAPWLRALRPYRWCERLFRHFFRAN